MSEVSDDIDYIVQNNKYYEVLSAKDDTMLQTRNLQGMLNTIWMVFVAIMTIFAQTGYFMVEIGSIRTHNNSQLLLKNILVVAISSIVFFVVGFGFSHRAQGGIVG